MARAQLNEAGKENNWIVGSAHTRQDVEDQIIKGGRSKIVIDNLFWDKFSAWVRGFIDEPDVVMGGTAWYGQKQPASLFL